MARTPFGQFIVIDGMTKDISSAPAWVRHKLRAYVELNNSPHFDDDDNISSFLGVPRGVTGAQYREVKQLVSRFGV